jgi:SAM-dependent methyltransferase
LDAAGTSSESTVLDLATGTGDAAVLACQRVGAQGVVIGVDISLPMLRVANTKSQALNLSFILADAMRLPFRDPVFDAVICQFGLMFFPDRRAALAEIRRILRPGGRIAFTVWGSPDRAPFAGLMARALCEELPSVRDELLLPFALADPAELGRLVASAGFQDTQVELESRRAQFESVEDFLDPYERGGGRLGQAYLQLTREARAAVRRNVLRGLAGFKDGTRVTMDIAAYLVSGVA